MKIKNLLQISPVVLAMACAFPLFAEDPSPAASPAGGGRQAHGGNPGGGDRAPNLSPEEREKVRAAHQKAMQDPKVQEAQKAFQDALKAAMLAADPTVGPLLEKMGPGRGEQGHGGPGGPGERRHRDDAGKAASPTSSASPAPDGKTK